MESKILEERFRIKVERIITRQNDTTTPHIVSEAPLTEEEFEKRPYLRQHYSGEGRAIPVEKRYESKPDIEIKTETTEVLNVTGSRIDLKALIAAVTP
jgi:hypothetical protein